MPSGYLKFNDAIIVFEKIYRVARTMISYE